MEERESREAFVTLATNDTYSLGCLVVGNSLRQRAQTRRQLVVMVTQGVTQSMRNQLSRVFDMIYDVNLLDSRDAANLQLLGRPDLSCTFTKLHCWRLTMFDKAVFLDADTLVLQNVDELFNREELSAAPDAGWPDCFNSGVFVYRPSEETYKSLLDFAMSQGSFDGGDQGLLNMYFRDWATKDISRHLPFVYNVVSQAFYSYLPAFTQFKQDVKIVHFIGATKPWHHPYNTSTREVTPLPETGHNKDYLQIWWNIFMENIQPTLDPSLMSNVARSSDDWISPPMPTFPALIPYIPPKLEQTYYSQNEPNTQNLDLSPVSEVVDIPVVTRLYSELESSYCEVPLSNVNPDNPDIYNIPNIVDRWSRANDLTNNVNKRNTDHRCHNADNNKVNEEIDNDSSHSDVTEGGLIGDLASMTIYREGYSKGDQANLTDQERKLNWERGQVDYLGEDKFENIQKKLDVSLQGPPTQSTEYTSSPFSRPNTTDEGANGTPKV